MFDEDTLYHMRYMAVDSGALFLLYPEKALFESVRTYFAADNLSGGVDLRCYDCMVRIISGRFFVYPVTAVWNQGLFDCPGGHISPIYFLCACDTAVIAVGGQGISRNPGGWKRKIQLLPILGLLLLGCLLEGYVNPGILLGVLKIL